MSLQVAAAVTAGGLSAIAAVPLARWLAGGGHRISGDEPRLPLRSAWWLVPLIGVGNGAATGLLPGPVSVPVCVFLLGGVLVAWIDVDVHRIPNRLLTIWLPLVVAALCGVAWIQGEVWQLIDALLGAAATVAVFGLLAVLGSLGMGDVKLGAVSGLMLGFLGWPHTVIAGVVLAAAGGAAVAIGLLIRGRDRTSHMPYGPAIVAGAIAAIAQVALQGWA